MTAVRPSAWQGRAPRLLPFKRAPSAESPGWKQITQPHPGPRPPACHGRTPQPGAPGSCLGLRASTGMSLPSMPSPRHCPQRSAMKHCLPLFALPGCPLSSPCPCLYRTNLSAEEPLASRGGQRGTGQLDRAHLRHPPALPSTLSHHLSPFSGPALPSPSHSPVPTPAWHHRGLHGRGAGRPIRRVGNWETGGSVGEKLRVLGSLCGHLHSGDREDPVGSSRSRRGLCKSVCVCVYA